MPYISKDERFKVLPCGSTLESLSKLVGANINSGGDLQYCLAEIINTYIAKQPEIRYHLLESIMGALNGANLEFYRCVVAPYENKKIQDNGPVYTNIKDMYKDAY